MVLVYAPCGRQLDDVPDIFGRIAEFPTCHTGTQTVITDANSVVFKTVSKVVFTFCHCPNKNADALFRPYI